jgi:phage baseplate assembly protein gpV
MASSQLTAPGVFTADVNSLNFYISQFLNKKWTSTLVKVTSVTNSGGVSPVGNVNLQPLVSQIDSQGKVTEHGEILSAIYFRLQGGADAIILDPKVGDIGIALFASRDISTVKNTKGVSAPASTRSHHPADAIYIGGVLNGTPSQYVQFNAAGISLVSPTKITLSAPVTEIDSPTIVLNGAVEQGAGSNAGAATFGSSVTAQGEVTGNGIPLSQHEHPGGTIGSGVTGKPVE